MEDFKEMQEQMKRSNQIKQDFEKEWSHVYRLAQDKTQTMEGAKKATEIGEVLLAMTQPFLEENHEEIMTDQIVADNFADDQKTANFCSNCGFNLSSEDLYCEKCGEKIR